MWNRRAWITVLVVACTSCAVGADSADDHGEDSAEISSVNKAPRYVVIRDAASARGVRNAYLLAGIANTETGLAQCWSEATWACQGPSSPDCGGGPVIAGASDGP